MRYWWVNQNQTYRHEIRGGYLWSPKRRSNQTQNPFYDFMREVAPGDIVSIWPWMMHRHRKHWQEPDAFDIDRFAGKSDRHRFQYLPFGGGPRTCVGAQFATAEALTILAQWLGKWRFVDAGHEVRPAGMVTLRPAGGLPLRLESRQ